MQNRTDERCGRGHKFCDIRLLLACAYVSPLNLLIVGEKTRMIDHLFRGSVWLRQRDLACYVKNRGFKSR